MDRSDADARAANLAENPYAGQGAVLLDVGGDVGALVVICPASMEGLEIEISRAGATPSGEHHRHHDHDENHHHDASGQHRPHVAVVPRPTPRGVQHSAVFPDLVEGGYELREAGGPVRLRVEVPGGTVTQADWPTAHG